MATEQTYKLRKGTEFPERFADNEVTYAVPSTLDEIRALIDDSVEDKDSVIVAGFNGQGYALGIQKRIKDVLASEAVKEMDVAAALAHAVKTAVETKLGAPRTRGEGGKQGKVAKAEARAESAVELARTMYRAMPRNLRKSVRPAVLAQGVLTETDLDAIDAEA